jgi:hypothetical protein
MNLTWHKIEDERHNIMHQQYVLLHQAHVVSGLPNPMLFIIVGNGSNLGPKLQGPMDPNDQYVTNSWFSSIRDINTLFNLWWILFKGCASN